MDAGPLRNLPGERAYVHAEPHPAARLRRRLFGRLLALVLIVGAGPTAALVNAPVAGPAGAVTDEQAVEVSATRVLRRRRATRSIRRRFFVPPACLPVPASALHALLNHRWPPTRGLPPPSWRGPPSIAL